MFVCLWQNTLPYTNNFPKNLVGVISTFESRNVAQFWELWFIGSKVAVSVGVYTPPCQGRQLRVNWRTHKPVQMCLMSWNKQQTYVWHPFSNNNQQYVGFWNTFFIRLVKFLPVQYGFYPSKWWVDGSIDKAVLRESHPRQSSMVYVKQFPLTSLWVQAKTLLQELFSCGD